MIFKGFYYPDWLWLNKIHTNEKTKEAEGIAVFNFCIGNRRGGKSVGVGIFALADFLIYGYQSVLIRRFLKDFEDKKKPAMENFWLKSFQFLEEFPAIVKQNVQLQKIYPEEVLNAIDWKNHELSFEGHIAFIDGVEFCYPVALNKYDDYKNNNFLNVHNIIYDEFIPEKGQRNLPGEVNALFNVYDTIARNRPDALQSTACIFIANAITYANDFFTELNIDRALRSDTKRLLIKDKGVAVEIVKNEIVGEAVSNSAFGRALKSCSAGRFYLGYSQGNDSQDGKAFIKDPPAGEREYILNLIINNKTYGLIYYKSEDIFYFTDKNVIETWSRKFTINETDHDEDTLLLKGKLHGRLGLIKEAYMIGKLYFNAQRTKNVFEGIYKYL